MMQISNLGLKSHDPNPKGRHRRGDCGEDFLYGRFTFIFRRVCVIYLLHDRATVAVTCNITYF